MLDSALNWSRDLPGIGFPAVHVRAGSPLLTPIDGGVRVWLPKAGRVVTWKVGRPIAISEIPAALGGAEYRNVIDTGQTMIVSQLIKMSDGAEARRLVAWNGESTSSFDTVVPSVPSDEHAIGIRGSQLLFWNRRTGLLGWVPAGTVR